MATDTFEQALLAAMLEPVPDENGMVRMGCFTWQAGSVCRPCQRNDHTHCHGTVKSLCECCGVPDGEDD